MKKKQVEINFSKKCKMCNELPIIGIIDLDNKGTYAAFCKTHLLQFCSQTMNKEVFGTGKER